MEKLFEDKGVTWLITKDEKKWQLFSNVTDRNPETEYNKLAPDNDEEIFYYANKNREQKGTLVYTPKGYGVMQNYNKQENTAEVRMKKELVTYDVKDILFEISINLKFIQDEQIKEQTIQVPSNITSLKLKTFIENFMGIAEHKVV